MSRGVALILINMTLFMSTGSVYGQTSAEINNLLKGSKIVDTGRAVNATVRPDKTTISTFCDVKASDQDCKITALLMMKELKEHYKSIHCIRVLFYSPENTGNFKEVEISDGAVALLDAGKPVKQVLSEIGISSPVARTMSPGASGMSVHAVPGRPTKSVALPSSTSTQGEFVKCTSADGTVSINYPRDWIADPSEPGVAVAKAFTKTKDGRITMTLYRNAVVEGMTLDSIVNQHEAQRQAACPGYRRIRRKEENCAGLPGIYLEAAATLNGIPTTERSEFLRNQTHFYGLTVISYGFSDDYMISLFNTISNSLRIRS